FFAVGLGSPPCRTVGRPCAFLLPLPVWSEEEEVTQPDVKIAAVDNVRIIAERISIWVIISIGRVELQSPD
ncbi:MAG: hypothetical protein ACPHVK_06340, partial [Akkermansiaceae bacterium]